MSGPFDRLTADPQFSHRAQEIAEIIRSGKCPCGCDLYRARLPQGIRVPACVGCHLWLGSCNCKPGAPCFPIQNRAVVG